ncbi:replication initiation protein [Senegalia sp. (in: firmicutes)]|uniref:replication initiation protein n=1 Tax=Senegalia sp. (in: firmicutes) TaxID=1924098 RepID=UPI003F9B2FD9
MKEENWVVKANKLIEAKGKLSMVEQKLFASLISEITTDDEDFKDYKLEIKEIAEFTKLNSKAVYGQIKLAARNLRKKEIFIEEVSEDGKRSFLTMGLLSSAKYEEGEGYIKVSIDPDLKPYLIAIGGKKTPFTQYMIRNILKLNSSYSIRIYELLKQCEKMRKREFEVEGLKELLRLEEKSYNRFDNFERRILNPAKKEINEKTDIWIDYKKIKKGRRIVKIIFEIQSKYKETEETKTIEALYTDEEIEEIKINSGLRNAIFNKIQIMQLYEIAVEKSEPKDMDPYKYINDNYIYTLQKGPKNKFAYLKKALQEDYANVLIQLDK